ncbi:MAG: DUF3524 domain-containing protein [Coriobacteriia bacterium]|nr:DUF3524 domain-containing protein [Coriobacteriia bacterium]
MDAVRLLAVEPYHGGSHRAVLDGLLERLSARGWSCEALTLPARKWKWRMRGSALTFAGQARATHAERAEKGALDRRGRAWDVVLASTFVNLAELKGLAGEALAGVPCVVYFHENQLVYPVRHEAEWDFQFPLTNITSALAADACLFNSRYNLEGFLGEIPGFMKRFPDHRPKCLVERIAARSAVLPPPFDAQALDAAPLERRERCRIVWPHRWEHDKDPEAFFEAVGRLADAGLDFEVAVAGQAFAERPEVFAGACEALGARLCHLGEPPDRDAYAALLRGSDVAVSTAVNEFFGIAMMEAAYAGCYPLVPDRLAYPELYPVEMRYGSVAELVDRLALLIAQRPAPSAMRETAGTYTFESLTPRYERTLRAVAEERALQ